MFVIELIYKGHLTEIDAHMAAHVMFLKKYYTSGNFLVSGRKIPRDGGIIVNPPYVRLCTDGGQEPSQAVSDTIDSPN